MSEVTIGAVSDDVRRDSERLQTLYVVNDMLRQVEAEGFDLQLILPRILHVAVEELKGRTGSIILVNELNAVDHFWHIDDSGLNTPGGLLTSIIDEGVAGWVIRHGQGAIIDDTSSDSRWVPRPDHPTTLEPWSALCAPLATREQAIGAITITRPGQAQFGPHDMSLLKAIASQSATSIENARLFEDSRRRAEELTTLITAALSVSTSLNPDAIFTIVTEQMTTLLRASYCIIARWEPEGEGLVPWAEYNSADTSPEFDPMRRTLPASAYHFPRAREVLDKRRTLQLRLDDPELSAEEKEWLAANNVKSLLTIPLATQERTVGLVQLVDRDEVRSFTYHEIALVQTLGSQAAITVENARLYSRTQRQLQESAFLNEASAVVNSSLDLQEIMHSLLDRANQILHVEAISVALVDKATDELVYEVAVGLGSNEIVGLRLPANQGVSGWVMHHGLPALVPDTSTDPRFRHVGDQRTGSQTRALICAPMRTKGAVLGTIQAINPLQGNFTDDDLQLLVKLANLASSAIANAQQFAETQAAEARYLSLFEDSIDPIILTDPTGQIVEVNQAACEFLGYPHQELVQLPVSAIHPFDAPFLSVEALQAISDTTHMFTSEVHTRENLPIPVEVYAKRLRSGDVELLQWIHHDISKQVELEEMREDLMAMLFHDLQSPLGNVISSLELMTYELDEETNPMATAILDIATRSSQRLRTLIKSLLDINRLEAGHPVTSQSQVTVSSLIDVAHEAIKPSLERRQIGLVTDVAADLPDLYVDADMIGRVLINLLENALKYSQDNQQLTVSARHLEPGFVTLSVSDQGPGIPEGQRRLIFDKFYRVPGQAGRKGMGLGLAFCRLAVEAHGGRIWADSAPGGGAQFSFTIPVARPEND